MDQSVSRQFDVLSCPETGPPKSAGQTARGRPWIGIHFECCGVYTRVYRDRASLRYEANCPKCGRRLCIRVGPDGINGKIFRATPV